MSFQTADSFGKATSLFRSRGFDATQFSEKGVKVTLAREAVDDFITAMRGALQGPEMAETRIVATEAGSDFGPDLLGRVVTAEVLVSRLKNRWILDAINQERYETWYQPIVHAAKPDADNPFAMEGLFRLRDKDGTIIPPAQVFDIVGQANLLFSVDLAARRSAVETAARARTRSKIFVNFNPSSIYDPAYCLRTTAAAIGALGMRPNDIVFELTETHRAKDLAHLKGILAFYRSAGFGVAIDDIGSGWSGLNMLHEFRPDFVKVDMDLVRDVDTDKYKQPIVEHLIQIAQANGIRTIGEGVETEAEAAWLRDKGVDYLQGFYFARPAPLQNFLDAEQNRRVTEAGRIFGEATARQTK
ncbi:MAG: EAL domain-containing protein [Alphaproteobacteria bacterium]|nr:EAL domain-containing protein [Alphaproteobacteria bacterium]